MELQALLPELPKRKNMSTDEEKTMDRCGTLWKGLKNVQKNEVLDFADVSSPTVHKTYKQGHLSASVCLSLAKTGGVAPLYLTGDTDKPGKFNDKSLTAFFSAKGLSKLLPPEPEAEPEEEEEYKDVLNEEELLVLENLADEEAEDYTEADVSPEELAALLNAMIIRARHNPVDAELLSEIKHLLLC